jgi:hypothetical protein
MAITPNEKQKKAKIMRIEEKAVLVKFSVSMPGKARKDKVLTASVKAKENLGADAGKWLKQLWPDIALEPLEKVANEARTYHYDHTLPWGDDGFRILPTLAHTEYTNTMRKFRHEFEEQTENHFLARYEEWVEWARQQHNGTFNADNYKVDKLRKAFGMSAEFTPIPCASDFRVALSDEELAAMTASLDSRVADAVKDAHAELWQRLVAPLQAMADKLRDPKAIFRDSLVGNLAEITKLIPMLNIQNDENLSTFAAEVETTLATLKPQELREDTKARDEAQRKAAEMLAKMQAYLPTTTPKESRK